MQDVDLRNFTECTEFHCGKSHRRALEPFLQKILRPVARDRIHGAPAIELECRTGSGHVTAT